MVLISVHMRLRFMIKSKMKYGKKKTRQLINSALEYYGEQRKIEETEES